MGWGSGAGAQQCDRGQVCARLILGPLRARAFSTGRRARGARVGSAKTCSGCHALATALLVLGALAQIRTSLMLKQSGVLSITTYVFLAVLYVCTVAIGVPSWPWYALLQNGVAAAAMLAVASVVWYQDWRAPSEPRSLDWVSAAQPSHTSLLSFKRFMKPAAISTQQAPVSDSDSDDGGDDDDAAIGERGGIDSAGRRSGATSPQTRISPRSTVYYMVDADGSVLPAAPTASSLGVSTVLPGSLQPASYGATWRPSQRAGSPRMAWGPVN